MKKCFSYWRKAGRLWFLKRLMKRRTRLPLYIILSLIIITQWYINFYRPQLNDFQKRLSKYRSIISQTRRLRYQLQILSFKFSFREDIKAITIRESENKINKASQYSNIVPVFQQWSIVIRVGCSHSNFVYFLESLSEALMDSSTSVVCVFALTCPEATREEQEVSVNMINGVEVCLKFIWNVSESSSKAKLRFGRRHPRIERLLKLKLQWWNFMNGFFQDGIEKGSLFNGILKDVTQDILFVDSNILLSPDFLQVATYASQVKSQLPGIQQLSLGTWGGQNLINAHPDTFAVRKSRELHALAYGINRSNWRTLSSLKEEFLEDLNPDWTESVGDALGKGKRGVGVYSIVPTLSRYWLITPSNTLHQEDRFKIPEDPLAHPSFPLWLLSPRLLSVNSSVVNLGVRDVLGFLCSRAHTLNDGSLYNAICYCSFWIKHNTQRVPFPKCFPQGIDGCLDSY